MICGIGWTTCRHEFKTFGGVFDIAGKRTRIAELETETGSPDLWAEPERAQRLMRELGTLRQQVTEWDTLARHIEDARELLELAESEEDEETLAALAEEVTRLEQDLEKREAQMVLSGPHDAGDAVLAIHAGAGGTEAQDWVEMLLRMYTRWAERKGYEVEITDMTEGEEAGIKSVTLTVKGPYAYGYLKAERGVHRLVRISPFDASARRHTSFALVEVVPVLDDDIEVTINPNDLRIDVFKSAGAGGQHVQKNATAVRIVHLPTGIVVQCQNERSQRQNREMALRILRGKLYALEQEKRERELARLKGKHVEAGWGNQIRSYVLQPYQLVKDLRTGYETGNVQAVLNGDLDPFIEAYLKLQVGEAAPQAA